MAIFEIARRRSASLSLLVATVLTGCVALPGAVPHLTDAPDAQPKPVATTTGPVRGVVASQGQAFLDIPFAAPPVGALRFAPPAPVTPWREVRDATHIGPACEQDAVISGDRSEDCLTLNVYAPHDAAPGSRLPVMVWIYGGALALGSNGQYDPSRLAEQQKVIVVAPNYRVGAFGFLAHPALRGPGEGGYGILDQQAALRWVRGNIAAFGGDAGNVTLFGESAGALSVCTHLALPGSKGLFQRAILESDTCTQPDTSLPRADAEAGGLAMARALGCDDPQTALRCLRAVPARALAKARSRRRGNGGSEGWAPMTGGDVLPQPPAERLAQRGADSVVPILAGSNHDEGRLFAYLRTFTLATGRKGYEKVLAQALPGDVSPVRAAYADVEKASYYHAYANIVTDSHFACPLLTLNRLLGRRAPFYAYEFDDPRAPMALPHVPLTPTTGAYHASEIAYVFQRPWILADPDKFDAGQWRLAQRIQDAWGAFARNGTPEVSGAPPWPIFDGVHLRSLSPDGIGTVSDFAERHRCAFWNSQGY